MYMRLFLCAFILWGQVALGADAIIYSGTPSQTLYARIYTSSSTAQAGAMTAGTSGNTRRYTVQESAFTLSDGSYAYDIFIGSPSTTAADPWVTSGILHWVDGAARREIVQGDTVFWPEEETDNLAAAVNTAVEAGDVGTGVTAIQSTQTSHTTLLGDIPTNSEFNARTLLAASYATATAVDDLPTVSEFNARSLLAASYATATAVDDLPTVAEFNARSIAAANYATASVLDDVPTTAEFNARTLASASYATASALSTLDGMVTNIYTAFELDGAVYRLTTNAVEQVVTGTVELDQETIDAIVDSIADVIEPTDYDQVQTRVTTALNLYDPPTYTEMVARTLAAADYTTSASVSAALNDLPTNAELEARTLVAANYATSTAVADLPTNAELDAALDGLVIPVDLTAQDKADIIDGIGDGFSISATHIDSDHIWRFENGSDLIAVNTIYENDPENGLVGMKFTKAMPSGTSIMLVQSVSVTFRNGTPITDEVELGSVSITADKTTVHIPLTTAEPGEYLVVVTIETVDSQVRTRKGRLTVR